MGSFQHVVAVVFFGFLGFGDLCLELADCFLLLFSLVLDYFFLNLLRLDDRLDRFLHILLIFGNLLHILFLQSRLPFVILIRVIATSVIDNLEIFFELLNFTVLLDILDIG